MNTNKKKQYLSPTAETFTMTNNICLGIASVEHADDQAAGAKKNFKIMEDEDLIEELNTQNLL